MYGTDTILAAVELGIFILDYKKSKRTQMAIVECTEHLEVKTEMSSLSAQAILQSSPWHCRDSIHATFANSREEVLLQRGDITTDYPYFHDRLVQALPLGCGLEE